MSESVRKLRSSLFTAMVEMKSHESSAAGTTLSSAIAEALDEIDKESGIREGKLQRISRMRSTFLGPNGLFEQIKK